jgi:hypothetical protein
LIEQWKDDAFLPDTDATIKEFLAAHTPAEHDATTTSPAR